MRRRKTGKKAKASNLKSHAGFWLRFVSNHVSHAFARKLHARGVKVAEWVVLREIYERDEMSPSVLADFMGVTRGAASKLVDRLFERKLITRKGRDDDRRFQSIRLTGVGRRLVPALAKIADQNDKEYFEPLSKRERKALTAILKKLVRSHGLHTLPTE